MATQPCVPKLDTVVLDRYSLIPAIFVVCLLHAFQYFKEKKLELIPPFLSLINDRKRKMVAMGFGAITNSILLMIVSEVRRSSGNTWGQMTVQTIVSAVDVIVVGIVNYPIFMCLQFPYPCIASICGVLYLLYRFVLLILQTVLLDNCPEQQSSHVLPTSLALCIPNIFCFVALISMFSLRIVSSVRQQDFGKTTDSTAIASDKELAHLREVLQKYKMIDRTGIRNSLLRVFKGTSKLSTIFVFAIVVILIIYYYLLVFFIYIGIRWNYTVYPSFPSEFRSMILQPLYVSHGLGTTVSFLVYLGILFQLIRSHEQDLKDLFAGKITLHNDMANLHPRSLVMSNIKFPAFLVAYMFWGLVSLYLAVLIATLIIYVLINAAIKLELVDHYLIKFLKTLYRIILVPTVVYIVQWLMTKFLFCQRDSNQLVMLRNIKLYHMTIYFNFFYNIVMGILSCLKRSLVGLAISFLFLGRIDRCSYAFFKRFDNGYRAYIGYMRMEALYKNPIMRCFIQFLNESTDANRNDYTPQTMMTEKILINKRKMARNRWHLAYTLIKNQTLINQRSHQKPNFLFKEIDDDRASSYPDTSSRSKLVLT